MEFVGVQVLCGFCTFIFRLFFAAGVCVSCLPIIGPKCCWEWQQQRPILRRPLLPPPPISCFFQSAAPALLPPPPPPSPPILPLPPPMPIPAIVFPSHHHQNYCSTFPIPVGLHIFVPPSNSAFSLSVVLSILGRKSFVACSPPRCTLIPMRWHNSRSPFTCNHFLARYSAVQWQFAC